MRWFVCGLPLLAGYGRAIWGDRGMLNVDTGCAGGIGLAVEQFVCRGWCDGVDAELDILRLLRGSMGEVSWSRAAIERECALQIEWVAFYAQMNQCVIGVSAFWRGKGGLWCAAYMCTPTLLIVGLLSWLLLLFRFVKVLYSWRRFWCRGV